MDPVAVTQFVLTDSRVFRPRNKHLELIEACREFDPDDPEELACQERFWEKGK